MEASRRVRELDSNEPEVRDRPPSLSLSTTVNHHRRKLHSNKRRGRGNWIDRVTTIFLQIASQTRFFLQRRPLETFNVSKTKRRNGSRRRGNIRPSYVHHLVSILLAFKTASNLKGKLSGCLSSYKRSFDIRALSELTHALDKKENLLMELRNANNDILENQNDVDYFKD
ncbi:hypothetical protein K1719_047297 [Acacia pycnantha]|nr:hypothetical protein K1719_047297 [Acacia pycnantha]